MSFQPVLPVAVPPSSIEQAYIDDSPVGLWPDNQDSNFGLKRKIFCNVLMDVANQLQLLINERFVVTASRFLNYWEEELSLPVNPPSRTIDQRHSTIESRLKRGAFTRTLRASIVESYVNAVLGGTPIVFGSSGVVLGAGLTLGTGLSGPASRWYQIVENISAFSYIITIDRRLTVDTVSLINDLLRLTPAGISFTLNTNTYLTTGGAKTILRTGGTKHP